VFLNSIGRTTMPFWMTEYGTPTAGGPNAFTITGQGKHQQRYYDAFDVLRIDGTSPCVIDVDFVYSLHDLNSQGNYYEACMGIYKNAAQNYQVKQPIHDVIVARATQNISGVNPPPATFCD
jgi:hypothetical protein